MKDKKLFITSCIFLLFLLGFILMIFSSGKDVFMPFITMSALLYFLSPPVNFFIKKGVKPFIATLIVYVFIALIILFCVFVAFPAIEKAIFEIWGIFNRYVSPFFENRNEIFYKGARGAYTTAMGAVKLSVAVFTGVVAAFYFLSSKGEVKGFFKEFIPNDFTEYFKILSDDVKMSLDSFFKGQIIVALILFVIDCIFLLVMKIPYAVGLSAIAAVLDIIPYVGAFIGMATILVVTFLNAPGKFLIVLIGLVVIQQIENNIISPKVSSDTLKLHPSVTVLSLYIGAYGGFWGILLAVPLTSVFCRIFKRLIQSLV